MNDDTISLLNLISFLPYVNIPRRLWDLFLVDLIFRPLVYLKLVGLLKAFTCIVTQCSYR